jgi:hypothetical protein
MEAVKMKNKRLLTGSCTHMGAALSRSRPLKIDGITYTERSK